MPTNVIEDLNTARALYDRARFVEAEQKLNRILLNDPKNLEANLLLGIVYSRMRRYDVATEHLQLVLDQDPENYDALIWQALTKKSLSAFDEAIELSARAIELKPDDAAAFNTMGLCKLAMRDAVGAIEAFQTTIQLEPNVGASYHNLGQALRLVDSTFEACEAFQRAVDLAPENIANYLELYKQLQFLGAWPQAVIRLQEGLQRHPGSVPLMVSLATALGRVGESIQAEDLFKRAIHLEPRAIQSYGLWLQEAGRFSDSVKLLKQAIKQDPLHGHSYYGLAEAKAFDLDDKPLIDGALAVIDNPKQAVLSRMYLSYTLAKAYDNAKDFESAMKYFDKANQYAYQIYNAGRQFSHERAREYTESVAKLYSKETIERLSSSGSTSDKPIFIVGMIRSGTTLLDQIISSHPLIKSAGEQQYWKYEGYRITAKWLEEGASAEDLELLAENYLQVLDSVVGESTKVTDKMPQNYEHLGLIHTAFPKAKIIHIRRDPIDTCLSIYMTHFSGGPNFAYNQENIACYYRVYLGLMEHWRTVIPADMFYEVDYEELVAGGEPIIRDLIEFCGLPWDEACLRHEENPGTVSTPSRWQARQPIYQSSVQRWKRYEPWLGALLDLKNVSHPPAHRAS